MLAVCSPRRGRRLLGGALALAALALPAWQRHTARDAATARLVRAPAAAPDSFEVALGAGRGEALLASWQTVGGCGSGSTTGAGGGVRWVGPIVTGGFFNVLSQATYMAINEPDQQEYHLVANTLISKDVSEKWNLGVNIPVIYRYMRDPFHVQTDLANSGLGDVYLQATRKLGAINDTLLTAAVGLPTGKYDQRFRGALLRQHQQLGFGRVAASLTLDHVMDELWGLMVVGATGTWRGGTNQLSSYRAPAGSAYGYVGYFLGKLVPSVGISLTGLPAHDRDHSPLPEYTGLFIATPTVALEWGNDWVGVMAGAAFPYQYDGITITDRGLPRSPWRWAPYTISLALSMAPF
jgi:hypothetical protein